MVKILVQRKESMNDNSSRLLSLMKKMKAILGELDELDFITYANSVANMVPWRFRFATGIASAKYHKLQMTLPHSARLHLQGSTNRPTRRLLKPGL